MVFFAVSVVTLLSVTSAPMSTVTVCPGACAAPVVQRVPVFPSSMAAGVAPTDETTDQPPRSREVPLEIATSATDHHCVDVPFETIRR